MYGAEVVGGGYKIGLRVSGGCGGCGGDIVLSAMVRSGMG